MSAGDALAHRRTGPDDVERRRLKSRQQLVDVVVARGRPRDRVAAGERLLEVVHHALDGVAEQLRRVDHALLGDPEHLRLGLVDRLGDVVGLAVGQLGDVACDVDQAPQDRRVLHDAGVVGGVRDRRRGVLQGVQRLHAADLLEQPSPAQFVGDGDRVGGRACRVKGADGVEEMLVSRFVEVVGPEALLADGTDRVAREQQRAEHRFLGLQVVRRQPRSAAPGAVVLTPRVASITPPLHQATLPGRSCGVPVGAPGFCVGNRWICVDGAVDIATPVRP